MGENDGGGARHRHFKPQIVKKYEHKISELQSIFPSTLFSEILPSITQATAIG